MYTLNTRHRQPHRYSGRRRRRRQQIGLSLALPMMVMTMMTRRRLSFMSNLCSNAKTKICVWLADVWLMPFVVVSRPAFVCCLHIAQAQQLIIIRIIVIARVTAAHMISSSLRQSRQQFVCLIWFWFVHIFRYIPSRVLRIWMKCERDYYIGDCVSRVWWRRICGHRTLPMCLSIQYSVAICCHLVRWLKFISEGLSPIPAWVISTMQIVWPRSSESA